MPINKQKKEEIIRDITEKGKNSESVVFANFHGLNVTDTTDLRRKLRDSGVDYVVAKKTLIKKAFESLKLKGEMPPLDGEIALAFGREDAVAPAREIFEFESSHKDLIKILGGVLEGEYMDKEKAVSLASIPTREVLYGKFVNVINSPIQGTVGVLHGVIRNFVSVLSKISN